ncbi:MAG: bifunctional UDP-N-acetylglucosamine diphosphorylase/glucosamine-1-phosphate N-acetyltransferase GlmU [Thermoanaerobaculia bacterium]
MTSAAAVVLLAAGRGTRLRSGVPKVLHSAAGRSLLERSLATARAVVRETGGGRLVVVTGPGADDPIAVAVRSAAPEAVTAPQAEPRGTGDAVRAALPFLEDATRVVVLPADVPLLTAKTVLALDGALADHAESPAVFLTAIVLDPSGYGRVLRDAHGTVVAVVEERDASEREREIPEVNGGVYVFRRAFLEGALARLEPLNAAEELYLTDVLAMAVESGRPARGFPATRLEELLGVNTRSDLARVEAVFRTRAAAAAMEAGATLTRPETVTLDETVRIAPDVLLEPFTTLLGATEVGTRSRIGQGSVLRETTVGADVTIRPYCVIEEARIGDGAVVGPFARLREGTDLGPGVHIGNFVETKKARLHRGAKANHLTYLGDTEIGERTNVGAGVITCNYDGFAKHRTVLGRDVFVGSDVQLVAPLSVGDGAVIGAGTTVTEDVPAGALVTSRSPQRTTEGGGTAYRERKGAKSGKKEK